MCHTIPRRLQSYNVVACKLSSFWPLHPSKAPVASPPRVLGVVMPCPLESYYVTNASHPGAQSHLFLNPVPSCPLLSCLSQPALSDFFLSHLLSTHLISSHLILLSFILSHLIVPSPSSSYSTTTLSHLINLISSNLTLSHLISSHLISSHLIVSHLIFSYLDLILSRSLASVLPRVLLSPICAPLLILLVPPLLPSALSHPILGGAVLREISRKAWPGGP